MIINRDQGYNGKEPDVRIKSQTCGRNQQTGQVNLIFPFILFSRVLMFIDIKELTFIESLLCTSGFL